jgi:hypothetical protein
MPGPKQIVSGEGGGQPTSAVAMPVMSPALEHRLTSAIAAGGNAAVQLATGVDPDVAQIMLRLTHDLRRLKDIQSIERKIDAKRSMLPDYRPWCDFRLELGTSIEGRELPTSGADDVLPTMMIWSIDVGDWPRALELAEHVLRFDVPLPARYQRGAAPLIAEEVATVALKAQAKGQSFPLDVLHEVDFLTGDVDMHDEIRAKLMKALGTELAREADSVAGTPEFTAAAARALEPLRRAQDLHDRVGAKMTIGRLQKAIDGVAKAEAEEAARAATDAAKTDAAKTDADEPAASDAGDKPETDPAAIAADTEQTGQPPVA